MRSYIPALVSILALSASCAALAQDTQPAPAVDKSSATAGSPLICRHIYHEGMLVNRQICHTKAEWEHIRFETQKEISDFQIRSLTNTGR